MKNTLSIYRGLYPLTSKIKAIIAQDDQSYQVYTKQENEKWQQKTHIPNGVLVSQIAPSGQHGVYFASPNGAYGDLFRFQVNSREIVNITNHGKLKVFQIQRARKNNDCMCFWAVEEKNNVVGLLDNLDSPTPSFHKLFTTSHDISNPILNIWGEKCAWVDREEQTDTLTIEDLETHQKKYFAIEKSLQWIPLFFTKQETLLGIREKNSQRIVCEWSPRTNTWTDFDLFSTEGYPDIIDYNPQTHQILLAHASQAKSKIYLFDLSSQQCTELAKGSVGHWDYFYMSGCLYDNHALLRWQSMCDSPQIKSISLSEKTSLSFKQNKTAQSVSIPVQKYFSVQGWLYTPSQPTFPVIIDLHGGPDSCSFDEYNEDYAYFVSQGYGVLSLNYRGSITFGKSYETALLGNPVAIPAEDCAHTAQWLKKQPFFNGKLFLQGWSWGGAVTLLVAGKYPDLFDAVASFIGIGDLEVSYHDEPAYLQSYDASLFGGTPEEKKESYQQNSPISFVEKIQSPLFIAHGKNDLHCPPQQIQTFLSSLDRHQKKYEMHWHDYGHWELFSDPVLKKKNRKDVLRFYEKCL